MKKILKPAIALAAICVVCAAALAMTNLLTKDKIEELSGEQKNASMQKLVPEALTFASVPSSNGGELYCAQDANGVTVAYLAVTSAEGYGGEISVMTAADLEKKILGVEILQLSETPNLGMKAKEPGFLEQFAGKLQGISVTKNPPSGNSIQAITGATITSRAVAEAVNMALDSIKNMGEDQ